MSIFRQVSLPCEVSGRLYLHGMPGRDESWDRFLREARRVELGVVVCLASEREIEGKSPAYFHARLSGAVTFTPRDFPIEDFGVPRIEEREVFRDLVQDVAGKLRSGERILIHCRMGIGRTGTVAACVLIELGLKTGDAIRAVQSAGSSPEVTSQLDFISWYSSAPGDSPFPT